MEDIKPETTESAKPENKKKSKKSLLWKIPLFTILAILLIAIIYVSYVFLTYSRIGDNKELEITGNAEDKAQTGVEYTAVTYNIGFGAYVPDYTFFMDGGKESRARSKKSVEECTEGVANVALDNNADFVLYQEVDTDSTRSFHVDQTEMIDDKFSDYDHVFAVNYHSAYLFYPITKPHGKSNSGILTESRFDVTSSLRRKLPVSTGLKKILDLDRCYSISRIPVENGKELVLINTHLSAYGTEKGQGNAQLEMIFDDMLAEYEKGNYVVCGGDFNHDFTGNSREKLNPGTDKDYDWTQPFPADIIPEGFSRCTDYEDGLVASARNADIPYSEESFTVVLDGFLISDNIECTYVQNLDTGFEYTDHNPVVMKFILNTTAYNLE